MGRECFPLIPSPDERPLTRLQIQGIRNVANHFALDLYLIGCESFFAGGKGWRQLTS